MDADAFPRQDARVDFDYMNDSWQPGDPRKGDEDRYLMLETLRAVTEGRVVIRGGQVLDRSGLPLTQTHPQGLDLDQEIDRAMAQDLSQDPSNEAG